MSERASRRVNMENENEFAFFALESCVSSCLFLLFQVSIFEGLSKRMRCRVSRLYCDIKWITKAGCNVEMNIYKEVLANCRNSITYNIYPSNNFSYKIRYHKSSQSYLKKRCRSLNRDLPVSDGWNPIKINNFDSRNEGTFQSTRGLVGKSCHYHIYRLIEMMRKSFAKSTRHFDPGQSSRTVVNVRAKPTPQNFSVSIQAVSPSRRKEVLNMLCWYA